MQIIPAIKGIAAGAAVGTAYYVISRSPKRQKNALKKSAGKTVRSFMTVLDVISEMI